MAPGRRWRSARRAAWLAALGRAQRRRRGLGQSHDGVRVGERLAVAARELDPATRGQVIAPGPVERQPAGEIVGEAAIGAPYLQVGDAEPLGPRQTGGDERVGAVDEVVD